MKKSLRNIVTFRSIALISLFCAPLVAFAGDASTVNVSAGITSLNTLITTFTTTVVKSTATLLLSAGLIAFFYGIVMYIWGIRNGDPKEITNGNLFMKWSLVALFAMFSVYGIIRFGQGFLCGTGGCDTTITVPNIEFKTGNTSAAGPGVGGNPTGPGTGSPATGGPGPGVGAGSCTGREICTINGGSGHCEGGTCIPDPCVAGNSCTKNGVIGRCGASGSCDVTSTGGTSCDSTNAETACGGALCDLTIGKCVPNNLP